MFAELPRALMNNEGVIPSPRAVTICDMTRYQKNWKISKMTMNKTYYCSENMNTESFFLPSLNPSIKKSDKLYSFTVHVVCHQTPSYSGLPKVVPKNKPHENVSKLFIQHLF